MQCPYCNKEMQKGFIKSSGHLFWSQEDKSGIPSDEELRLSKISLAGFFVGHAIKSHFCPNCKKIITPVD